MHTSIDRNVHSTYNLNGPLPRCPSLYLHGKEINTVWSALDSAFFILSDSVGIDATWTIYIHGKPLEA